MRGEALLHVWNMLTPMFLKIKSCEVGGAGSSTHIFIHWEFKMMCSSFPLGATGKVKTKIIILNISLTLWLVLVETEV